MKSPAQPSRRGGWPRRSQPAGPPVKPRTQAGWLGLALIVLLASGCGRASARAGPEATLPELNRALSVWTMAHGAAPQDVSQLTNILALQRKSLPKPPPGKKLVIDPASQQVIFADQ